ncbi:hypothetical protein MD484_g7911, partial [Candolleomyces efflorescens]
MAPPTKYRSCEARLQANRDKSARSYEKYIGERKISTVNDERSIVRQNFASVLREEAEEERLDMSRRIVRTTDHDATFWTSFWLEEAQKHFKIYQASIRGDGQRFVSTVCDDYLARANVDPEGARCLLETPQEKAARYQKILTDLRDKVLNSAGIDREFKEIDKLVKRVVEVGMWLEDISILLLEEGTGALELAFHNRELSFQK